MVEGVSVLTHDIPGISKIPPGKMQQLVHEYNRSRSCVSQTPAQLPGAAEIERLGNRVSLVTRIGP